MVELSDIGQEKLERFNTLAKELGHPTIDEDSFYILDKTVGIDTLLEMLESTVVEKSEDTEDTKDTEMLSEDEVKDAEKNFRNALKQVSDTVVLGDDVEDTVTGFAGVITATTFYLNEESMCLVENKDGERWFAQSRLEEI